MGPLMVASLYKTGNVDHDAGGFFQGVDVLPSQKVGPQKPPKCS